ncbi:MAG TPA: DUF4238 domain-containing protein [Candidatus Saccharibacteria bacterium]|nr:DUF4238 domain-containing protein [Candidatus Saccharibacteria bacterium]HRQ98005.1 DUF4238 domain-containing protein [Candidatus Saccharibacteria bacterium]
MTEQRTNFDHYVAQHYVKRFANNSGFMFVGNISNRSIIETSDVTRIMGERNWSVTQQIEDAFSSVESSVARAFTRIKEDPTSIEGLALTTKRGLADFIVIHLARSAGIHNFMNTSTEQFEAVLSDMAPDDFDIRSLGLRPSTRPETLQLGVSVGEDFEPIFRMKGCVALRPSAGKEFILGDNPFVSLTSQNDIFKQGEIFAAETYFWLPLNPQLGIFMAKDIGNKLFEGKIILGNASEKLTNTINRAESYLASNYIVGSRRGVIRNKLRIPNIGNNRSEVVRYGFSPIVISNNLNYLKIEPDIIATLKQQFNPS